MSSSFNEKRRQQFLTQAYSSAHEKYLGEEVPYWKEGLYGVGDTEEERKSLARSTYARFSYELLSLRYTAGHPIEQLRSQLTGVVEAYEHYQKALADYEQIPEIAPLGMGNIGDYERCMQLIGLCYLLHRRDLLSRIAALEDPGYEGEDALYEDLLAYELSDRTDTDELLHLELYDPLLGAMYDDTDEESKQDLNEYLNHWYPAFKYIPWHDGHLRIDGTEGDYFGYWAFEAGAVAYLCDINDSHINHMIYPKDLVAWARANKHLEQEVPVSTAGLRVPGGKACPQTG